MLKTPWLVQRYVLDGVKLEYDYMGANEFERGDQAESLKRIFEKGLDLNSTTINFGGKQVTVYMIAAKGFSFADYQPYLQRLADRKLRLKELTNFDIVVEAQVKGVILCDYFSRTNAWFDFQNDVLWTLTEDNQKNFVLVLEDIYQGWSEKK